MQHVVARVGFPWDWGCTFFFCQRATALTTQVADLVWKKGGKDEVGCAARHRKALSGERMMCFFCSEGEKKYCGLLSCFSPTKKSHSIFVSLDQLSEENHETRRHNIQRKMRSAGSALHARGTVMLLDWVWKTSDPAGVAECGKGNGVEK